MWSGLVITFLRWLRLHDPLWSAGVVQQTILQTGREFA